MRLLRRILVAALPLAVVAGGAVLAWGLLASVPKPERRIRAETVPIVDVVAVRAATERPVIEATGRVRPVREIEVRAQVGGPVDRVAPMFQPGGLFRRGELMLRIDPADFDLAVRNREAELAQAEAALAMEQGNQAVAREELAMLGGELDPAQRQLVLRQPQLVQSQAAIGRAVVALEQARLSLARTRITAPFDAVLLSRSADLGAFVANGATVAQLADTARFWVTAGIALDDLDLVALPDRDGEGAEVEVSNPLAWGFGSQRTGRVERLDASVDADGQTARLYIAVDDPMALEQAPAGAPVLLLGQTVQVRILGKPIPGAATVPRDVLRPGDTVWVLGPDDRLEIRAVEVAYRGREAVVVRAGLAPGERVVASRLAAPVDGMRLGTADRQAPQARGERPQAAGGGRG